MLFTNSRNGLLAGSPSASGRHVMVSYFSCPVIHITLTVKAQVTLRHKNTVIEANVKTIKQFLLCASEERLRTRMVTCYFQEPEVV